MDADIRTQTRFYQRGMVLGLTMAEIVTLMIFALLLALAALLKHKDQTITALQQMVTTQDTEIAALHEQITAGPSPVSQENRFSEMFRELSLARQEATEARQQVAALQEQAQTLNQIVTQFAPAQMATAPPATQSAWISERLALAEALTWMVHAAGLRPENPQMLLTTIEQWLPSLIVLRTALDRHGSTDHSIDEFVQQTLGRLHQAERHNTTLQGQLRNLQQVCTRGGKGTEKPACWASPETGAPEYIFRVALRSTGIIVWDNALPYRREEQQQLPPTRDFGVVLSPSRFLTATQPLFEWSTAHNCRFFVRVLDRTRANEKATYKHHLRIVGQQFYYYEDPQAK